MMPNAVRRVVLISGHYLGSKRRAGFHHLAEAYWRAGWDVTFVTAPISFLSRLRRDYRFAYPVRAEANTLVTVRERMTSFVLMTPMHPVSLRSDLANRLAAPLFARYARISLNRLKGRLAEADLIVFEGSAALLLVDRIRNIAPKARLVYRVSDDLRRLGVHPLILEAEAREIPLFDEVSVPADKIADVLRPSAPSTSTRRASTRWHSIELGNPPTSTARTASSRESPRSSITRASWPLPKWRRTSPST